MMIAVTISNLISSLDVPWHLAEGSHVRGGEFGNFRAVLGKEQDPAILLLEQKIGDHWKLFSS